MAWAITGIVTLLLIKVVQCFTFTNTLPSSCDNITISWIGGQPPFYLLIIPAFRPLINISIPSNAFQNNEGRFVTQLQLPLAQRILLSMSDATGLSAGGITPVLTVNTSASGTQCNTTSRSPDFFFSLDDDLVECKPFPFSQYSGAVQPVVITAWIAGGQSFQLFPPKGDSTYTFQNNNLTAGTSVLFSMMDSQGRDGGVSDIKTVRLSSTGTTCAANANISKKSNIGAIVGGVVGALLCSCLIALGILLWVRRRRNGIDDDIIKISKSKKVPDLLEETTEQHLPPGHAITPYRQSMSSGGLATTKKARNDQETATESARLMTNYDDITSASGSSTSAGASQTSRSRFIVHTDITEIDDEPIELPPQYSEGRAPILGLHLLSSDDAGPSTLGVPRKS